MTDESELYQSERWSSEDFHYDLPISEQGKYVLVLKFSEVYFNSPGEKIFDVKIGTEAVIRYLDIFAKVGKATAYDEYVEFELKDNKIYVKVKIRYLFYRINPLKARIIKSKELSDSLSKKKEEITQKLTPLF